MDGVAYVSPVVSIRARGCAAKAECGFQGSKRLPEPGRDPVYFMKKVRHPILLAVSECMTARHENVFVKFPYGTCSAKQSRKARRSWRCKKERRKENCVSDRIRRVRIWTSWGSFEEHFVQPCANSSNASVHAEEKSTILTSEAV